MRIGKRKRRTRISEMHLAGAALALAVTGAMPVYAMAADATPGESDNRAHMAQEQVYALGETIVTATRVAEPLHKVPANVTVITSKEIEKRNAMSVRDILSREMSVFVSPTADTKDGLTLRGFSSTDLLVLYNGQQINAGFDGSLSWDTIPVDDIDRIEIVRGAGSSLYGGHAVAGIVHIVTKTPSRDGKIHGSIRTSYGSDDTWRRSVRVNGSEDGRLTWRLGYEKRTTDGWPGYFAKGSVTARPSGTKAANAVLPKDAAGNYLVGSRGAKEKDSENISFGMHYDFTKETYIDYSYTHADYRYDYHDPFTFLHDAAGRPIYNGYVTIGGKNIQARYANYLGYHGERAQEMHALRYEDTRNGFKVEIDYNDVYKDGYSSVASSAPTSLGWTGTGERSSYPSKHYGIDVQKTWKLGMHTLLAGGAWMKDTMQYRNYKLSSWKNLDSIIGEPTVLSGGNLTSTALFVQDEFAFAPKWAVQAGLRYDKFDKRDGYSSLWKSAGTYARLDYKDARFAAWSPKLAISYAPEKDMLLYASFGKSFNPPSIFKLYRRASDSMSSVRPNPELEPESSNTFEIGWRHRANRRFSYSAAIFRMHTRDKIALATIGGVKSYYNMNEAFAKGFELGADYRPAKAWRMYLNYTFESAALTANGVTVRNWDIPKHMLHIGVDWAKDRWNVGLDGTYVGARQDVSDLTGEYGAYDGYFTANLYANFKPTKDWKVQCTINNIFNRKFYAGEAANGRTYALGFQYDF